MTLYRPEPWSSRLYSPKAFTLARMRAVSGSFYAFPNFSCFGLSSLDLAAKLVEEAGVMTLPGTEFGPAGEGYLRLSVVAGRDRVEEGVRRLQGFARERSGRS